MMSLTVADWEAGRQEQSFRLTKAVLVSDLALKIPRRLVASPELCDARPETTRGLLIVGQFLGEFVRQTIIRSRFALIS